MTRSRFTLAALVAVVAGPWSFSAAVSLFAIVYPKAFANAAPVLPLPASSLFGAR